LPFLRFPRFPQAERLAISMKKKLVLLVLYAYSAPHFFVLGTPLFVLGTPLFVLGTPLLASPAHRLAVEDLSRRE
jgi:hypothetical protein